MCLEKRIGRWGLRRAHLNGEKPVSSPWFSSKDLLRSSNRVSVDVATKASGSGLIDGALKKRIAQITLVPWHSESFYLHALREAQSPRHQHGYRGADFGGGRQDPSRRADVRARGFSWTYKWGLKGKQKPPTVVRRGLVVCQDRSGDHG